MNSTLIELHVPDFKPVHEFYSKLGFTVCWERLPEEKKGYLVMALEDNLLCFWPGNECVYAQEHFRRFPPNTPRGYGVEIVLQVSDVRALYEICRSSCENVEPLKLRPWGLEDFRLTDPFGYYLRITNKHDVRSRRFAVA